MYSSQVGSSPTAEGDGEEVDYSRKAEDAEDYSLMEEMLDDDSSEDEEEDSDEEEEGEGGEGEKEVASTPPTPKTAPASSSASSVQSH